MVTITKYNLFRSLFFSCCLLSACLSFGQAKQETRDTIVYGKVGSLSIKELSANGKWVSYSLAYENGADTLFLQNSATKAQLRFPNGSQSHFGGTRFFAYKDKNDLIVRQLESGKTLMLPAISRYFFVADGSVLVTLTSNNVLELRNDTNRVLETVEGVTGFELNDANDAILYSSAGKENYEIGIVGAATAKKRILATRKQPITKVYWRLDGKAAAWRMGSDLEYFDLRTGKIYSLSAATLLKQGKIISNNPIFPLSLSDDGEKVFLGLSLAEKRVPAKGPEIWNGNDARLYPGQQSTVAVGIPLVGVWFPKSGVLRILSDENRYTARLTGKNDFILLSDPFCYGTEPAYPEKVDYYIKNVNTGAEKLLLKRQPHDSMMLCFSPLSNAIAYYCDGQWWLYTPETDITICLTSTVKTEWDNNGGDAPTVVAPFGLTGWTADGKSVLLNDKYDIWKVALDGRSCVRITNGKEVGKEYRLHNAETSDLKFRPYSAEKRFVTDWRKELLLNVENQQDWSTGYELYQPGKGIRSVDYGPQFRSGLQKSKNNAFVFLSETYERAPQLNFVSGTDLKLKTLYSSPRQDESNRKSALVTYKNSKGTRLKAALFYPDGYDASKQYPMVVKIYEKKSNALHRYSRITPLSNEGIVLANFTASGYFVLYPDFELELGNPGPSATDCVVAAVEAAILKASVNPKKIGLIGHSYGGYETNFIITQTDIFAAAVSGAGISNTIGRYFGLAFGLQNTDMYRYESQQWRMGTSFFSNKQGYWDNSPVMNADKIRTPLLIWHGKQDDTIPFDQSVSYYLALRRLGLPTIMLAYPDEGHEIRKPLNQADLTDRIAQWFDYFLKDQKATGWITNGITTE